MPGDGFSKRSYDVLGGGEIIFYVVQTKGKPGNLISGQKNNIFQFCKFAFSFGHLDDFLQNLELY